MLITVLGTLSIKISSEKAKKFSFSLKMLRYLFGCFPNGVTEVLVSRIYIK